MIQQILVSWTALKALAAAKKLSMQYIDDGYQYHVFTMENGVVVGCALDQNPSDTTDLDDFENNYKAGANQPIYFNARFRNSYSNITGNSTTTVVSGSGIMHGLVINKNYTGGTVTVYDNTAGSGTKIMSLQIATPSGGLLSTTGLPSPVSLSPLGIEFSTGLTVVTAGSTSNDVTVIYRA